MARLEFNELAYNNADELIFGKSKKPVTCKNGLVIGGGEVIPELNYTLPMMQITEGNHAQGATTLQRNDHQRL